MITKQSPSDFILFIIRSPCISKYSDCEVVAAHSEVVWPVVI
jgi:hypothetical protein